MYIIFILPIIIGILWIIINVVKYSGLKSALFRGKILQNIGSITFTRGWMQYYLFKGTLKVHVIERQAGEKEIGLEIVYKSPLSYEFIPVSLSFEEAKLLTQIIGKALQV
jgi:hypothetical protein